MAIFLKTKPFKYYRKGYLPDKTMIILKSDVEIQRMRISSRIAAEILAELGKKVVPGTKTVELEEHAIALMREKDCTSAFKGYNGFPAHICVSINEVVVHGIPGPERLKEGDIVSIDVGILKDGYYGDTAATFPVGRIDLETKRLLQFTKEALRCGIDQAKVGNRLGRVSYAIESVLKKAGFSVVRDFVGHGIGQSMHEDPQVPNFGSPDKGPHLKHGMVLAIEPMVNQGGYKVAVDKDGWTVRTKDRLPSAHFEHTVAVLNEGAEVLTLIDAEKYQRKSASSSA